MSETSAAAPRDHLADMTRERDGWRVAAMEWKLAAATWAATAAVAAVGLLVMGAVVAWSTEPVRAQVQCMDPVRVTHGDPAMMQTMCKHDVKGGVVECWGPQ
jgi:hypothetical protein